MGKSDEMLSKALNVIFFPNLFNKFNITWTLM